MTKKYIISIVDAVLSIGANMDRVTNEDLEKIFTAVVLVVDRGLGAFSSIGLLFDSRIARMLIIAHLRQNFGMAKKTHDDETEIIARIRTCMAEVGVGYSEEYVPVIRAVELDGVDCFDSLASRFNNATLVLMVIIYHHYCVLSANTKNNSEQIKKEIFLAAQACLGPLYSE